MFSKIRSSIKGEPAKKGSHKKKSGSAKKLVSSWGDVVFFFILGSIITVAVFYFKFYRPLSTHKVVSETTSSLRESLLTEWKVELIRELREIRRSAGISDEFDIQDSSID